MQRKVRKGLLVGNFITEIRKVFAGLIRDLIKEDVPKNKYIDGQNFNLTQSTDTTKGGATPALGNEVVFEKKQINFSADTEDYKGWRIALDISAPGIVHDFVFTIGGIGTPFSIVSALGTPGARYVDLKNQLSGIGTGVYIDAPDLTLPVVYVGYRRFFVLSSPDGTLTEEISSVPYEVFVIKEFYGLASNGIFQPLKTLNIGNNLYVIASNGAVIQLCVAVKDETDQTWTYTEVLQTKQIQMATDTVIDLDGQIDFGNRVSLYFTGKPYLPRAFYVTLQDPWAVDSAMIYNEDPAFIQTGNPIGQYTYENIEANTRLQVVKNLATVSLVSVNNSGGILTTGNKMYLVRQRITVNSYTGFNLVSNPVSIVTDPLNDLSISGNQGGVVSSKSVTLDLNNLDPDSYDMVQLVVVENIDGAMTAKIVNDYPITSTTVRVTHTGTEITSEISIADISTQQIIFKTAGNLVINLNRLFISDIETATEPDISEWAQTIGVTTQRTTLTAIGTTFGTVNEYQKPENIFDTTGYMLNETDRFAIIVFYKNGLIGSPVFIADHQFTFADSALTVGSGDTPEDIYVFYPEFSVNLTTADPVEGVPFADAIYGYSIVRRENIPEAYWGMALPSTSALVSTYEVGRNVAQDDGVNYINDLTQIGLLVPDLLFGDFEFSPASGDQIRNFGQSAKYNTASAGAPPITPFAKLLEFNGVGGTPEILTIDNGIIVAFNSVSSQPVALSQAYSTRINQTFGFGDEGYFNQQSIGIHLTNNLNPITANFDYGFYLTQYFKTITNKYGDTNAGTYQSCGHFRSVTSGITSYTEDVFGGYAFTQKNFFKFCNGKDLTSAPGYLTYTGVSFYTQNRGNYQYRYFASDVTFLDYPYTTTNLLDWLSGNPTGSSDNYAGTLTYSLSYTPINNFQQLQAFDPELPAQQAQTNTIYYSDQQIEGALGDALRNFLPNNKKAYPLIYGAIKNTFRSGNRIIILQERAILSQQLDLQQQQTDPEGVTIIIGDGTVLGAQADPLALIGAPTKTGAIQYTSNRGGIYIAWYNKDYNKWFRLAPDGIRDLGLENQMQSFLTQNGQFIEAERSVIFGYDYYTSELLISTNADVPNSTPYDSGATYSQGDIVYVEGYYTTRKYYQAQMDVPVEKDPTNVANLVNYWSIYRNSNYTLAFNEEINAFSSFYSYTPTMFIPYKKTMLSFTTVGGLDLNVYEHNRFTNMFYEDPVIAYLTIVFNDQPSIYKKARDLFLEITEKPIYMIFRGLDGSRTYGEPQFIIQKRDYWWQNVRNDAMITTANPTGLNTTHTRGISGETIDVTIYWQNSEDLNRLKLISFNMIPKPRYFNT